MKIANFRPNFFLFRKKRKIGGTNIEGENISWWGREISKADSTHLVFAEMSNIRRSTHRLSSNKRTTTMYISIIEYEICVVTSQNLEKLYIFRTILFEFILE